jgi:hypothetical protein
VEKMEEKKEVKNTMEGLVVMMMAMLQLLM